MANSRLLKPFRRWRKMIGPGKSILIEETDHGKKRSDCDEK